MAETQRKAFGGTIFSTPAIQPCIFWHISIQIFNRNSTLQFSLKLDWNWWRWDIGIIPHQSRLQPVFWYTIRCSFLHKKWYYLIDILIARYMEAILGILNQKWMCYIGQITELPWNQCSVKPSLKFHSCADFLIPIDADFQHKFNACIFIHNNSEMRTGSICFDFLNLFYLFYF